MSSNDQTGRIETFSYDNNIVKNFVLATVFWGAIALFLGVVIASQLIRLV